MVGKQVGLQCNAEGIPLTRNHLETYCVFQVDSFTIFTMTKPNPWPFPTADVYQPGSAYNRWSTAINSYITELDQEIELEVPVSVQLQNVTEDVLRETDPNGLDLNSPGAKADAGKNRAWLFMAGFSRALEEVSKVTTIGATKYTPNGWVDVPDGQSRYMDAFARHMFKLGSGELMDDGPGGIGTYHKAQMIWNLLASFELELRENDNRSTD